MIRALLRLYPARWRARYGEEFAVVLGERPLGPYDVADVVLGAIDARLHLRGVGAAAHRTRAFSMTLRIGGYAALVGGPLWVLSLAGASAMAGELAQLWLPLIAVATGILLVALSGLSAFQARRYPVLVWLSFTIPALGALVSIVGLIGMTLFGDLRFIGDYSAWVVWMVGMLAMFGGSALFGFVTWASRTLSRPGSLLLAAGSTAVFPLMGIGNNLPAPFAQFVMLGILSLFALGWAVLGVSALRLDRRAGAAIRGSAI
jgi:hypothetical protein